VLYEGELWGIRSALKNNLVEYSSKFNKRYKVNEYICIEICRARFVYIKNLRRGQSTMLLLVITHHLASAKYWLSVSSVMLFLELFSHISCIDHCWEKSHCIFFLNPDLIWLLCVRAISTQICWASAWRCLSTPDLVLVKAKGWDYFYFYSFPRTWSWQGPMYKLLHVTDKQTQDQDDSTLCKNPVLL